MRHVGTLVLAMALSISACRADPTPPAGVPEACDAATGEGARMRYSFDEIVACLDTPEAVSAFVAHNIDYDPGYDTRERGGNEYVPAATVYERGIDDADGHAILQCDLLERNGWSAEVVGLSIDSPLGSNVCAVVMKDGSVLILEGGGSQAGPFGTLSQAAAHYIDIGWMQPGGVLRTLPASKVTRVTTDQTTPSVLGLPWVEVPTGE